MKKYSYPDNGKYIQKTQYGTYRIVKTHYENGKHIFKYYGRFKDYNEAIRYRDKCVEANWDIPPYVHPLKFIKRYKTKNGESYKICKDGEHYGTYHNIIDAMNERDLLIANGWDIEKVCELTDDTINGVSLIKGRGV